MNAAELKRAKRAVRREVLFARDALSSGDRRRRSARIAERAASLPEVERAAIVMAFWSFGSEVDTSLLIERLHRRGASVLLPRIASGELEARSYTPGDPVTPTSFGAFEPMSGAIVEPTTIDVIITPGVAFDRCGRRIGYGGGFYDRFLRLTRDEAVRVGIAFQLQLVEGELPAGRPDFRVDIVVTEREVVRCADAG